MQHRYPGPHAFTGDDRRLFFGRETEIPELFRLIVLNDIVVLLGESGTGKTSLLQAGVCPELEERQYKPVFIRLNNTAEAPELQVCRQLKAGGYIPADMPEDRTLWEYFSRFWYVDLGEVYTPVIVFDQFEELFTLYKPEERRAFVAQFAAVANGQAPPDLPPEAAAPPRAKFVFGIRSDFLYLLDDLSADIPAILRCRFQLRRLDRERASEAITRPAAMEGDFTSPPFRYSPAALSGILEALGRHDADEALQSGTESAELEIAAVYLQQVCRYLEDQIIQKKCAPGFEIRPEFYGAAGGIQRIIDDFYNAVLSKLPPDQCEPVEKLLARGLLRNGRRIMMESSAIHSDFLVSQAALELLHDERLLNREARKGELYYEISHDTLIKPVLERFKKIEEAEKEAAAQREREELERVKKQAEEERSLREEAERAKEEAEKQRAIATLNAAQAVEAKEEAEAQKNIALRNENEAKASEKRARQRTRFAIVLALLAVAAAVWAFMLERKADEERNRADQEKYNAQQSLINAYKSEIARDSSDINSINVRLNAYKLYGAPDSISRLDSLKKNTLQLKIDTLQLKIDSLSLKDIKTRG